MPLQSPERSVAIIEDVPVSPTARSALKRQKKAFRLAVWPQLTASTLAANFLELCSEEMRSCAEMIVRAPYAQGGQHTRA
eukprot:1704757-Pleurochrysis_carterae.AAC.2